MLWTHGTPAPVWPVLLVVDVLTSGARSDIHAIHLHALGCWRSLDAAAAMHQDLPPVECARLFVNMSMRVQAYIGPPTLAARYEIIRTSLQELAKRGIITGVQETHQAACEHVTSHRMSCLSQCTSL